MNLFSFGMHLPLCFLFTLAYYANGNYHINREDFKDPSLTEDKEHTKYTENNLRDIGKKFYDEADPYHKELEKRALKAVLFGATLFLTLTNVATDIFLGNNGCCIIHETRDDDACDKLPNIQRMTTQLAELGTKMDEEYLQSQLTMTYLDNLNNQNFLFRNEIQRLRDLEESIIVTMDPKLVNEFKSKVGEIKVLLNEGKEQTTATVDITELYSPLYKSWQGRLKLFGVIGLHIVGDLGEWAFDRAVLNGIRREVEPQLAHKLQMQPKGGPKATKVLGGTDDIKLLSTSMAKTKIRMEHSKLNAGSIMRGFTKFMTVVAIGVEIHDLYHKFHSCTESYKKLVKAEENLIKTLANATGTYEQIKGNRTEINNQYKEMKDALTNETILDNVGDFRDFVLQAESAARRRMRPAEINLPLFLKYIKVESPSLTSKLQELVIEGFASIEIRYDCLQKRIKSIAEISSDCKAGKNNLTALYEDTSNKEELYNCVTKEGEPFTTFEQIKEFIEKDSTNSTDQSEWYSPNCRMNDELLLKTICKSHCQDGHSYEDALKAEKVTSITIDEVKKVCEPNGYCDRELTPNEKEIICNLKNNGFTVAQVKAVLSTYPADKTEQAFNDC